MSAGSAVPLSSENMNRNPSLKQINKAATIICKIWLLCSDYSKMLQTHYSQCFITTEPHRSVHRFIFSPNWQHKQSCFCCQMTDWSHQWVPKSQNFTTDLQTDIFWINGPHIGNLCGYTLAKNNFKTYRWYIYSPMVKLRKQLFLAWSAKLLAPPFMLCR